MTPARAHDIQRADRSTGLVERVSTPGGGSSLPQLTVPGTVVHAQWRRDPGYAAPNDTLLSNAIEYTARP